MSESSKCKTKVALAVALAIGTATASQVGVAGGGGGGPGWGATELVNINLQWLAAEGLIAMSETQDANKAGVDVDAGAVGEKSDAFASFGTIGTVSGDLAGLSNNPEGWILFGSGASATAGGDFGDPSLSTSSSSAGGSFAGVESNSPGETAVAEGATVTYALGIVSSDLRSNQAAGEWNSISAGDDSEPDGGVNTATVNVSTDNLFFNGPGALSFAGQAAYTDGEGTTGRSGTVSTYGGAGSGNLLTITEGSGENLSIFAVIGTTGGGSGAEAGLALSGEINTAAGAATGGYISTTSAGTQGDADASAAGASAGLGIVTANGCFNCNQDATTFNYNVVSGAN